MTNRDDIGKQLDAALHAAFPTGDVNYPQTPHTERARALLESAIAIAGTPVHCYNFHEVGKVVTFNRSYVADGGGVVIGAWSIKVRTLDTLSDAAIVQMYVPVFKDYEGQRRPRVLKHSTDDE